MVNIFITERLKDKPGKILSKFYNVILESIVIMDNILKFRWKNHELDPNVPYNHLHELIDYNYVSIDGDYRINIEKIEIKDKIIIFKE